MPGVLELLPADQVTFQRMLDIIRSVYERFGFLPIETPAIELTDILLTKTGGETERQVYFVQSTGSIDHGAEPELALRFDLTVPLARYVAEHEQALAFPFRRYQIQRVYRGESPQRGRFREFYQCDIDVIGRDTLSLRHDAEMPAVIDRVFTEMAIGPFTIRVNNRRLMKGLLASLGVEGDEAQARVLREIDKLEKRGSEAVAGALADWMAPAAVDRVLEEAQAPSGTYRETFARLASLESGGSGAQGAPLLAQGAAELRVVFETMVAMGVPESRVCLDLSIARGLEYYTGTVYETRLDEHPEIGSICSGGRYDDLAGHYTSSRLPGVGISIGLTRLFWQLREAGLIGSGAAAVTALVTLMDDEGLEYGLRLAGALRGAGIATVASLEPAKLGKQLRYADRLGIRFALIAGGDERGRGTVTLRDLSGQTQEEVPVTEVAGRILATQE
jgi:histidyl-tRNA synthetase